MARVIIPTALRQYADQQNEVEMVGGTVDEALGALTGSYPALRGERYSAKRKVAQLRQHLPER